MIAAVRKNDLGTLVALLSELNHSLSNSQPSNTPLAQPALGKSPNQKHGFGGRKKSCNSVQDPNQRDEYGNTALHVAVSLGNLDMLETLLSQCPRLNVNLQEYESGYTALHKALYSGNLSMALLILRIRGVDVDLNLRDFEGNTCLDLMNSTVEQPKESIKIARQKSWTNDFDDDSDIDSDSDDEPFASANIRSTFVKSEVACSLWTWGSNSNYSLGHQNSDDRAFPERVDVTQKMVQTQGISASIQNLSDFAPRIIRVVMSKYHTCILAANRLFVCGFGKGGRLGVGHEETVLQPVQVLSLPGKVSEVAVGPDHTVVVMSNGRVWSWGSNEFAQLGYLTEDHANELLPKEVSNGLKKINIVGVAASKFHTAVFTDGGFIYTWGTNKGQLGYTSGTQWTPRKITQFPQQEITQIAATATATAVLTSSSDIYIFADNEYTRVQIQFAVQTPLGFQVHRAVRTGTRTITKLVSGHHHFAILTNDGDVYMWVPPSKEWADTWEQKNLPQKRPVRIWSGKKKFLKAVDVAIGIDSSVMIVSESRHVYHGSRRSASSKAGNSKKESGLFKFIKIPFLQHISMVSASSSGSLCAIRNDIRKTFDLVEPGSFRDDLKSAFKVCNEDMSSSARFTDMEIYTHKNIIVRAHSVILAARSSFFKSLFKKAGVKEDLYLFEVSRSGTQPSFLLHLDNFHHESVQLVLEYIYAGTFRKAWDSSVLLYNKSDDYDQDGNPTKAKLYRDFNRLVKLFQLDDTELILYSNSTSVMERYKSSFTNLLSDSKSADIIIIVNGDALYCHQPVLGARSNFFRAILHPHTKWTLPHDSEGRYIISLPHLDSSSLDIALKWIYGETDIVKLLGDIKTSTPKLLQQSLVDILAIANELLLDSFKEIIAYVLCSFIHLGSVLDLLHASIMYEAPNLSSSCLDFICWNLESFIESSILLDIELNMVEAIQTRLLTLQKSKFPYTRGPLGYARIKGMAIEAESDRKAKRRQEYDRRVKENLTEESDPFGQKNIAGLKISTGPQSSEESTEYITERTTGGSSATPKKEFFRLSSKDENIFEMELDDSGSRPREGRSDEELNRTPVKSKKGWRKMSLQSPELKPQKTSNHTSPSFTPSVTPPRWSAPSSQEKSKVSLRDVMSSQHSMGRPPLRKSPAPVATQMSFTKFSPGFPGSPTTPMSQSPLFLGEPFHNVRIVTGKQSQKERRRSQKNTSPTLPPQGPVSPWALAKSPDTSHSLPSEPRKTLKEIQQEELFKRESLEDTLSRTSLLTSSSWAQTARSVTMGTGHLSESPSTSSTHVVNRPSASPTMPLLSFTKLQSKSPKKTVSQIQEGRGHDSSSLNSRHRVL